MKIVFIGRVLICILTLIIVLIAPVSVLAKITNENEATEQTLLEEIDAMLAAPHVPGEIIFFLQDGITLDEASTVLEDIGVPNNFDDESVYIYRSDMDTLVTNTELWFTVYVGENQIRDYLYKLSTCPYVNSVSPNMLFEPTDITEELSAIDAQVTAEADAPLESYDAETTLWAMEKMGVAEAWKAGFTGSSSVIIAVLDTGFTAHDDIACINTGLYPSTDIACVNTSLARNTYVSNRLHLNSPFGDDYTDESGHGTFIIGQIGASLNENGVNGICQAVTIVPVKISLATKVESVVNGESVTVTKHYSNSTSMARGARYAKNIGASVINLSYEIGSLTKYNYIAQEGFDGLFVVAAGNHGIEVTPTSDNSGVANDHPNWIIVGNSTSLDQRRTSSNVSSVYVDLFAPGTGIQGCGILGNDTVEKSGTSMAAPQVTAAAALIISHATHLTMPEVRQLLIDTAAPIDALNGLCVSGGRLSIINAVNALYDASRPAYSRGDSTGDGKINAKDYMMIKRIVLGTYTADSNELQGADASGNNIINTQDYMMVKRFVFETYYFPPV